MATIEEMTAVLDKKLKPVEDSVAALQNQVSKLASHAVSSIVKETMLNPVVLLTGGTVSTGGFRSVEVFSPWQDDSRSKDLEDLPHDRNCHTINLFKGDVIICSGQDTCGQDASAAASCLSFHQKRQRFVPHSKLIERGTSDIYPTWYRNGTVANDGILLMRTDCMFMQLWDGSQWVKQEVHLGPKLWNNFEMAAINNVTLLVRKSSADINIKMFKYEDVPGPHIWYYACAGIPKPRMHGKILVANGRIIMVGGKDKYGAWILEVEEYNIVTKIWVTIEKQIKRGRIHFVPEALVTNQEQDEMSKIVDKDEDGKISYNEFNEFLDMMATTQGSAKN